LEEVQRLRADEHVHSKERDSRVGRQLGALSKNKSALGRGVRFAVDTHGRFAEIAAIIDKPLPPKIVDLIHKYDFIDLGGGSGNSLEFGASSLAGTSGIGVDVDHSAVSATIAAGFDAIQSNASKLALPPGSVRFALLFQLLSRTGGTAEARSCISVAVSAARDFVMIREPWFDSDGYLFTCGMKVFWSDLPGLKNKMSSLDIMSAVNGADQSRIVDFHIYGRGLIRDSRSSVVHPLRAPPGDREFDADRHDHKPYIEFTESIYTETITIVRLNEAVSYDDLLRSVLGTVKLL
jgi:hypothetical protein